MDPKGATRPGMTRRTFGLAMTAVAAAGCGRKEQPRAAPLPDSPTVAHARRFAERHLPEARLPLMLQQAREVERDFSTGLIRTRINGQVYEWPANFSSFKARSEFKKFAVPGTDRFELPSEGRKGIGGLTFFWPTLEGYSLENWVDDSDRRRIGSLSFSVHEKDLPMTTEQVMERLHSFGAIEATPGVSRFGLSGYRWNGPDGSFKDQVEWIGRREDGGLFHMRSHHPDGPAARELFFPQCAVEMVDRDTGEEVSYRYSLDLLEHWREIEHGTRRLIHSWRKT